MSNLFNPYALTALGKPLKQRQSPELRAEGGPMTRSQLDMARFVFGRFLEQARLSYVPNPTQQGFLSDGSRFRIVTASGAPIMQVWPVTQSQDDLPIQLDSGIIVSNTSESTFYRLFKEDGQWRWEVSPSGYCGLAVVTRRYDEGGIIHFVRNQGIFTEHYKPHETSASSQTYITEYSPDNVEKKRGDHPDGYVHKYKAFIVQAQHTENTISNISGDLKRYIALHAYISGDAIHVFMGAAKVVDGVLNKNAHIINNSRYDDEGNDVEPDLIINLGGGNAIVHTLAANNGVFQLVVGEYVSGEFYEYNLIYKLTKYFDERKLDSLSHIENTNIYYTGRPRSLRVFNIPGGLVDQAEGKKTFSNKFKYKCKFYENHEDLSAQKEETIIEVSKNPEGFREAFAPLLGEYKHINYWVSYNSVRDVDYLESRESSAFISRHSYHDGGLYDLCADVECNEHILLRTSDPIVMQATTKDLSRIPYEIEGKPYEGPEGDGSYIFAHGAYDGESVHVSLESHEFEEPTNIKPRSRVMELKTSLKGYYRIKKLSSVAEVIDPRHTNTPNQKRICVYDSDILIKKEVTPAPDGNAVSTEGSEIKFNIKHQVGFDTQTATICFLEFVGESTSIEVGSDVRTLPYYDRRVDAIYEPSYTVMFKASANFVVYRDGDRVYEKPLYSDRDFSAVVVVREKALEEGAELTCPEEGDLKTFEAGTYYRDGYILYGDFSAWFSFHFGGYKAPAIYADPVAKHRYRELDYDGEWAEFSGDDFKTDGKNGMPIGTENHLISVDGLLGNHSKDSVRFAVDANSGGLLVLSNLVEVLIDRDGSVVELRSVTDEGGETFPMDDINIEWCAST